MHVRDQERQIAAAKADHHNNNNNPSSSSSSNGGGNNNNNNNFTVPSREMGTQTPSGADADAEAMLANVSRDGSPAYVSLG